MNDYYIIFGQSHTHKINNVTLDKDCVAVIKAKDEDIARQIAFSLFSDKFATSYTKEQFGDNIKYYPRGFIKIN